MDSAEARNKKSKSLTQRYYAPNNEQPYHCNLCDKAYTTRYTVKRHFLDCWVGHGKPKDAAWDDHPSCLTSRRAFKEGVGRPFYPDYYTPQPDGRKRMTWPTGSAGSGWPREEAELLRQNSEYRKRPNANHWYIAFGGYDGSPSPIGGEQEALQERQHMEESSSSESSESDFSMCSSASDVSIEGEAPHDRQCREGSRPPESSDSDSSVCSSASDVSVEGNVGAGFKAVVRPTMAKSNNSKTKASSVWQNCWEEQHR